MSDVETPKSGDGSPSDVRPVSITEEMKRTYLDYAMSVIVSRALPDVRDGLKPVHRRILYSMHEQGHTPDKKYVKSARVVGDVMGKYHPHGDQAIYDALVRMAQDFSMRLQLIDGQGNFGSVDGDPPAAMRYTECRLAKPAMALLDDIDKDTVDFQANYDGNEHEPVVLPARYPNLLVNGAGRHLAGGVDGEWIAGSDVQPGKAILYFHGGGFRLGSVSSHRELIARISRASGCRVLAIS